MEVVGMVGLVLGVGICVGLALLMKWNAMRYRRKGLPPGSMGLPFFGETAKFLTQGPTFVKMQRARYGNFFKTHIFGCPTVICMDPGVNRYILLNEGKGLVAGYPPSMRNIIGNKNIAAVHGATHKYIRGSLLSLIAPPVIKDHLLQHVDGLMRSFLHNWDGKTIDIQDKTSEMALLVSYKQMLEIEPALLYEAFKPEFDKLVIGTLAMPINLPGTNYYFGFQGRKNVLKMLRKVIAERRASSATHNDMLGDLLSKEDPKHSLLSDEEILDQIITILYSGYETVSKTTMMSIKYLHDNPKALQQLREEHLAIRKGKNPEDPIRWTEYKSMTFTRAVILETSRLATIVNGVLRETTNDIEVNGYVIPKGWRIYVYTRETNYDPLQYPEPFTFNPWRWLDKSLESQNYCFLFGAGNRVCPGKELGIVKISMFLHHLVTRYRWEEVGDAEIAKFPRVEAPKGLHIKITKY
ncbi:cytochrome P450 85A1-like [Vitis riparia]|uniref:cytochrome P450 85A1-like n=1 Tax=Vitis riparia TaxID=96939 RepID=UPI00155AAB33|nr:cytochrome P450 85A1-like [Vitis riparia]